MLKQTSAMILGAIGWLLLIPVAAMQDQQDSILDRTPEQMTSDDLWQTYYGWRQEDNVEQAHAVALQLMERSALGGERSLAFGRALAEVGITELLGGEFDRALMRLHQAESILREHLPIYSEKLVPALGYLGAALQSQGRHGEAMDAFSRAQHITHRLGGAHNPDQIRLAQAKAQSAQALGDWHHAEEMQRFVYRLFRENFGPTSEEAVNAALHLGAWLRSIGDYHGSIAHYHDALEELQGSEPDIPQAFPLLKGMAHAYRGGYRGKYARTMYRRLVGLTDAYPESFTLEQRISVRLEFGDWLMQRYFERDAIGQYRSAWQLAAEAGQAGEVWVERLSRPRLVRYERMAPQDLSGKDRFVRFAFDITADGRVRRGKIDDHQGASARDRSEARRAFPEKTRFRPAIIDGQAVGMEGQSLVFYLLPPGMSVEPDPIAAPGRLSVDETATLGEHGAAGLQNISLLAVEPE